MSRGVGILGVGSDGQHNATDRGDAYPVLSRRRDVTQLAVIGRAREAIVRDRVRACVRIESSHRPAHSILRSRARRGRPATGDPIH